MSRPRPGGLAVAAAVALAAIASPAALAHVDLHAHPFMDDGMGSLFRGRFEDSRLKARDWHATFESQINEETLEASGLELVVVSLYAHPLVNAPRRKLLRSQLDRLDAFLKAHPRWALARSAAEARQARASGKGVVVLALEGAAGVLESDEDLREFVDRRGVRIVTLLHLTDDHLGGAAFFSSFKGLFMQPVSWLAQAFRSERDETGARLNRNGLSDDGVALAAKLLKRGVWIDLAHSSDESQKRLIPLLRSAGQPLLYTHTSLRRYARTERAISDAQLAEVAESRGIVGLMPSEPALEGTKAECDDGLHRLAAQFREVGARIGAASTVIGSDFNGGIAHLAPPACPTGTDFDRTGLWNIGQSGALWRALETLGAAPAARAGAVASPQFDAFVTAWSRAETPRSSAP
ncbi:MAG: membrane dipeptidase [Deltaproteobacteria bacterium]|nr:membrane dipeptidase [Deltaproteobacteria bacterium]